MLPLKNQVKCQSPICDQKAEWFLDDIDTDFSNRYYCASHITTDKKRLLPETTQIKQFVFIEPMMPGFIQCMLDIFIYQMDEAEARYLYYSDRESARTKIHSARFNYYEEVFKELN